MRKARVFLVGSESLLICFNTLKVTHVYKILMKYPKVPEVRDRDRGS